MWIVKKWKVWHHMNFTPPPSPCHKLSHFLRPLPPSGAWHTLWTAPVEIQRWSSDITFAFCPWRTGSRLTSYTRSWGSIVVWIKADLSLHPWPQGRKFGHQSNRPCCNCLGINIIVVHVLRIKNIIDTLMYQDFQHGFRGVLRVVLERGVVDLLWKTRGIRVSHELTGRQEVESIARTFERCLSEYQNKTLENSSINLGRLNKL